MQYVEAWLLGNGCVPLYNLMEDAATAEISRAQLWQWLKHKCLIEEKQTFTKSLFIKFLNEELDKIKNEIGVERFNSGKFDHASTLFKDMIISDNFDEFLTLPAYNYI